MLAIKRMLHRKFPRHVSLVKTMKPSAYSEVTALALVTAFALTAGCSTRSGRRQQAEPAIARRPLDGALTTTTTVRDGTQTTIIPPDSGILVAVVVDGPQAISGVATLWERDRAQAPWVQRRRWPVVIGGSGIAWGRGLHGDGPPPQVKHVVHKREGDGRSPAGAFSVGRGFYDATTVAPLTQLTLLPITEAWRCVDDPRSKFYNQVIDSSGITADWSSAEAMHVGLYELGAEIGHNPSAVPAAGSCIFFHLWGGPTVPTVGCTAMAKPDLIALLAALDHKRNPIVVQLTNDDYATVRLEWQLPALE